MNILKQFIGADQVDDTKILLRNAQYLRARNAANSANVNLLRLNASDIIEFASQPQFSGSNLATEAFVTARGVASYVPKALVTSNVTISNPGTAVFDSVTLTAGQLLFLAGQSTQTENGLWTFNTSSTALTRPAGWTTGLTVAEGTLIVVDHSAGAHSDQIWKIRDAAVIGTNNVISDLSSGSSSGANTALSNLASTAVNVDLLPAGDEGIALGGPSNRWSNAYIGGLVDPGGVTQIRLDSRWLVDSGNQNVVQWESKILAATGGGTSLDWQGRILYDTTGTAPSIWYGNRIAYDSSGTAIVINWQSQVLYSNDGLDALQWGARQAIATDGSTTMIQWQDQAVGVLIGRDLLPVQDNVNSIGGASNRWVNLSMEGSIFAGGEKSVDVGNRKLHASTSTAALQWASARVTILGDGTGHGNLQLNNFPNTFSTSIQVAASLAADWTMSLPATAGTAGYFLQTDGTGITTWAAASGGGANTALSNLVATDINQDLLFTLNATTHYVGTKDNNAGASDHLAIVTGNLVTGATGQNSGNLTLATGNAVLTNDSGSVDIHSGSGESTGQVAIYTSNTNTDDFNSGEISFATGNTTGIGASGQWVVQTGSAVGGDTGLIRLATGDTTTGVRGAIELLSRKIFIRGNTTTDQGNEQMILGRLGGNPGGVGYSIETDTATAGNFSDTIDIGSGDGSAAGSTSGDINFYTRGGDVASGQMTWSTGGAAGASGQMVWSTGAATAGASGGYVFTSGTGGTGGPSGSFTVQLGAAQGSQASGLINLISGNVVDGIAGQIAIQAGNATGTGTPGFVAIQGGNAPNGVVGGAVQLTGGAGTTAKGGSLLLYGGDTSSGGETGDVILKPGQVTGGGGTPGFIKWQSSTATVGYVLTATNADGSADWAPASGGSGNGSFFVDGAVGDQDVNVSNPGTAVFDGVTLTNGQLLLLIGQSTQTENGVWTFHTSSTALTRPTGWTNGTILLAGMLINVVQTGNNQYGQSLWQLRAGSTVGTDPMVFDPLNAARDLSDLATITKINSNLLPDGYNNRELGSRPLSWNRVFTRIIQAQEDLSLLAGSFDGNPEASAGHNIQMVADADGLAADIAGGAITIRTTNITNGTGAAATGGISIGSGSQNSGGTGDTGDVSLGSGSTDGSGSHKSGNLFLTTGDTPGISGDILIRTGIDGVRGIIKLQARYWDFAGDSVDQGQEQIRLGAIGGNASETGFAIISRDASAGNTSDAIQIYSGSGSAAGSSSGGMILGSAGADVNTGVINIYSGPSAGTSNGQTGAIQINTGAVAAGTGVSGALAMSTGNAIDGNSGAFSFTSGSVSGTGNSGQWSHATGSASGAGQSGGMSLISGNTTAGQSGSINIQTGTTTGGAAGGINLIAGNDGSSNYGQIQILGGLVDLIGYEAVRLISANGSQPMPLRFMAGNNATWLDLVAPATIGTSFSLILPAADGTAGQSIVTDGAGTLSFASPPTAPTWVKQRTALSGTDITNQYIDLAHVAKTDSITFYAKGSNGMFTEGAGDEYTVSYTGGAGGNTRITFLNDIATGGTSALTSSNIVVVQYQY